VTIRRTWLVSWVSINDGKSVELFKYGTGAVGSGNITWKTEGKRFVLSSGNTSKIGDYNLSGYERTRTFDDGTFFAIPPPVMYIYQVTKRSANERVRVGFWRGRRG